MFVKLEILRGKLSKEEKEKVREGMEGELGDKIREFADELVKEERKKWRSK